MKNKVLLVNSHGAGDCCLSFCCAHFVEQLLGKGSTEIFSCTRDEVFAPLQHLFGDLFDLKQHPQKEAWGNNNWVLTHLISIAGNDKYKDYQKDIQAILNLDYKEIYYIIPDLLFNSPIAFDYKKYNTNPQVIRQTRLLTHKYKPEKRIYVGLCSSTDGYVYNDIPNLLRNLGKQLPDYEVYFPNLKSWAGKTLNFGDLDNMPSNVRIDENPNFLASLEVMKTSVYGIYTDNGSSHCSFQMGQSRLVLDPHYNKTIWQARWREDMSECIDINASIKDIISIVKSNIDIPQTLLLPRQKVLDLLIKHDYNIDWGAELLFKF